jgi:acetyl-CoA synthetase
MKAIHSPRRLMVKVLVVRRTGGQGQPGAGPRPLVPRGNGQAGADCKPEKMKAEDPLFMLYTSGSTGKPKGVLHTTGGYLVYASMTHQYVFDYQDGDIYWCTADVGWVTGHSYIVYGPLANGATTLMFEGVPNYPNASRFWEVVDKHKVNIFYTAPTAIRALMGAGRGTGAEDLTQVAAHCSAPSANRSIRKPGNGTTACGRRQAAARSSTPGGRRNRRHSDHAAARRNQAQARFGHQAVLRRASRNWSTTRAMFSKAQPTATSCITDSWPGQMRTIYGDHERFVQTYFSTYKGMYFTGDGCRRDADGYYWITGRVDDVINVSGHRWARRKWSRHWSAMPRSRKPPWSATRTTSRVRASIAT